MKGRGIEDDSASGKWLLGTSATSSGDPLGESEELDDNVLAELPRAIGRFAVLRRVGRGGMGEVFSAYDEQLERRVAIKLLQKRPRARESRRARMLREAQAMAQVSHPNVVQVFEAGDFKGRTFIAMEYIEGQTLERWQRAVERPRDVILDAYLQAGAGLAAAHQAGVLHRDFKPTNAIIDQQGRVRVMDFGLAAWLRRADSSVTDGVRIDGDASASASGARAASDSMGARLTRAGAMLGTPAFMASEQYRGQALDARTDQFAFCVSLYEALVGVHPFGGDSPQALREAILEGKIRDASTERSLPQWLRRSLRRGLARDRDERWPDMESLLQALHPKPRRARRIWLAMATGAVAVTVGGAAYWGMHARSELCSGAQTRLEPVWNEARRQKADKGLARSGVPLAASAWRRVEKQLEGYTQGWVDGHTRICEATHARGEQSAELMDRRMSCMHLRLEAVDSLLATFEDADVETVLRAVEATAGLPPLEPCETLGASSPADPEGSSVEGVALRRRLIKARASLSVGRFTEARAEFDRIRNEARTAELPRLSAEALVRRGQAEREEGLVKDADRTLEEGLWEALGQGADEAAFDAALGHMAMVGMTLGDRERGMAGIGRTEAILRRVGNDDAARSEFQIAAAGVLARHGEFREARERIGEAMALASKVHGETHVAYADALAASGMVAVWSDDLDEAERIFTEVLELDRTLYDPRHTRVASPLNNLAIVLARRGDFEAANEKFREAYELRRAALGDQHVLVADSLMNMAGVSLAQGRTEDALKSLLRARDTYATSLGEGVAKTNEADLAYGMALTKLGRDEEAETLFRSVLARQKVAMGEEHPDLVLSLGPLGTLLTRTGRGEEAVEVLTLAVALERDNAIETGIDPMKSADLEKLREYLAEARVVRDGEDEPCDSDAKPLGTAKDGTERAGE